MGSENSPDCSRTGTHMSDVRILFLPLSPIFTLLIPEDRSLQKKDNGHNYTTNVQCQGIRSINIYPEVLGCQPPSQQ